MNRVSDCISKPIVIFPATIINISLIVAGILVSHYIARTCLIATGATLIFVSGILSSIKSSRSAQSNPVLKQGLISKIEKEGFMDTDQVVVDIIVKQINDKSRDKGIATWKADDHDKICKFISLQFPNIAICYSDQAFKWHRTGHRVVVVDKTL